MIFRSLTLLCRNLYFWPVMGVEVIRKEQYKVKARLYLNIRTHLVTTILAQNGFFLLMKRGVFSVVTKIRYYNAIRG